LASAVAAVLAAAVAAHQVVAPAILPAHQVLTIPLVPAVLLAVQKPLMLFLLHRVPLPPPALRRPLVPLL